MAANSAAGPSNSRKRKNGRAEVAPVESFGKLELAQEEGEAGSVDEDYGDSDEDDEDADFPEIDDGSDSGSDEEEDEGDLSEDEQILRELAEEEELERELAETSDSSLGLSDIDSDDPDALDQAIKRATGKPQEDFEGDAREDARRSNNEIMGFDTRNFKEKAVIGKSAITGKERWTWKEIEPIWEDDEGAAEVRRKREPTSFVLWLKLALAWR